jgi:ABC-2 type transport system ATP-binding protein
MLDSELIHVTDLRKHYGDVRAVDGVSFAVPNAAVFTLLGPNGAGKTTTLEILEGIREADAGEIVIFGARLRRVDRATKQRMGVLLQEGNFEPYLKAREVITLFASFFRNARPVDEMLERVALTEKANTYVKHLSGGQKQRLAIGAALVNSPELVFLDEPTTGLDPQARRNVWSVVADLKSTGVAIVLTTHYMEEAEALSDLVCIMDNGKLIAEGSPRELAARLGQETIIEFAADGVQDEDLIPLHACCAAVRSGADLVSVETEDLVVTMGSLLQWSKERDLPLANMTVRQPNLEDVFLSLTGRRLRE